MGALRSLARGLRMDIDVFSRTVTPEKTGFRRHGTATKTKLLYKFAYVFKAIFVLKS
jgi:hypothetical protein